MITKEQNTALLAVAKAAEANPKWKEYADYCVAREKGLRKEAFKLLESFLQNAEHWAFQARIDFLKFIFVLFETLDEADYGPFPQPLSERIIKPTLEKWCETEAEDSSPFRWFGTYYGGEDYLFKALEIDPADDLAREKLLKLWTYNIYYSVHHLPEGYIGDVAADLLLIERINEQINLLTTEDLKEKWKAESGEDMTLVHNYTAWEASGHPDFEKWGKENNRETGYGTSRVYYYGE